MNNVELEIINYTEHPVQVQLSNADAVITIAPTPAPYRVVELIPHQELITLKGITTIDGEPGQTIITYYSARLESEEGFPAPKDGVRYIVEDVVANALRKTNRGVSDILVRPSDVANFVAIPDPEDPDGGIRRANILSYFEDDPDTVRAVVNTWRNRRDALTIAMPTIPSSR